MDAKIIAISPKKIVGLRIMTTMVAHAEASAALWPAFAKGKGGIGNRVDGDTYSIQIFDGDPLTAGLDTPFEKWAGVEVSSFDGVPEGFACMTLRGGLYAVFVHRGLPGLETHEYALRQWLPASEYALDAREQFERMGPAYHPNDPNAEEEVWIPIQKKQE